MNHMNYLALAAALGCITLASCSTPNSKTVSDLRTTWQQQTANIRQEISTFQVPQKARAVASTTLAQAPVKLGARQGGTAVPVSIKRWEPTLLTLTVADANTARSAYGYKLRLYEVHFAKMLETSAHICNQEGRTDSLRWGYIVANAERGTFSFPCSVARSLRQQFGTIKPERTTIVQANGTVVQQDIPVLNINGARVDRWIIWVQQQHPLAAY